MASKKKRVAKKTANNGQRGLCPAFIYQNTGPMVGLGMLIFIAAYIGYLFYRRKKIRKAVADFYERHALRYIDDPPPVVKNAIGNPNAQCFVGDVALGDGNSVHFYWWRFFTTTTSFNGNASQTALYFYLGISFLPGSTGEDFQEGVVRSMNRKTSIGEKIVRFFKYDTITPIRAERLPDDSFLIVWRSLDRADVYENKIDWLRSNVTLNPLLTEAPRPPAT